MTEEQINIAIAEVCGWRKRSTYAGWVHPSGQAGFAGPPDYVTDLNAMHEAEKTITFSIYEGVTELQSIYIKELWRVMGKPDAGMAAVLVHATARQRAEAFLRTLNLWTE